MPSGATLDLGQLQSSRPRTGEWLPAVTASGGCSWSRPRSAVAGSLPNPGGRAASVAEPGQPHELLIAQMERRRYRGSSSERSRRRSARRHPGVSQWALRIADNERSTSASVVAQELRLMRMAIRLCQVVEPHQHWPEFWILAITWLVLSSLPNAATT